MLTEVAPVYHDLYLLLSVTIDSDGAFALFDSEFNTSQKWTKVLDLSCDLAGVLQGDWQHDRRKARQEFFRTWPFNQELLERFPHWQIEIHDTTPTKVFVACTVLRPLVATKRVALKLLAGVSTDLVVELDGALASFCEASVRASQVLRCKSFKIVGADDEDCSKIKEVVEGPPVDNERDPSTHWWKFHGHLLGSMTRIGEATAFLTRHMDLFIDTRNAIYEDDVETFFTKLSQCYRLVNGEATEAHEQEDLPAPIDEVDDKMFEIEWWEADFEGE